MLEFLRKTSLFGHIYPILEHRAGTLALAVQTFTGHRGDEVTYRYSHTHQVINFYVTLKNKKRVNL
ncbi:hypothetical protein TRIP_E280109 [uncultured Spirochaetota bacterium]|uniref:Uncharacterized protein n=1 Tax=uncultured Spirochaetota bacterium TaxID=460511 RepID=A0A652ZWG5_9SPIR|nr:hypothetical protein TRIP_E280109 [uncultured Spirochaetota bacterium]